MLLELLACTPVVWLLWLLLKADTTPLLGVYAQPGRWYYVKYWLMRLMLRQRRRQQASVVDDGDEPKVGYGRRSRTSHEEMDGVQPLGGDPFAVDAVYFNGVNNEGVYFILRLARRPGRQAEIWLSIDLPGVGFYQSPTHPDTLLYNTEEGAYSAGGLKFECVEPMKRWKVSYSGLLREGLSNTYSEDGDFKTKHVSFSFVWEAFTDMFDFDTDIDPGSLASAVAREKWSKQFWDTLKSKHQTHYEQWGELKGVCRVEGHDEIKLTLRGVRDHSYGVRDWRMFHRYNVVFGYLDNGITFHVNTLSWTGGLSYLQCGYLSFPNATMVPITAVDLDLPALGENNNPPDQYSFSFTADGKEFSVFVKCGLCPVYYHQDDWGNVIYEKFATIVVNGIKGRAVSEFCYRRPGSTCPVPQLRSLPLLTAPSDVPATDRSANVLPFTRPAAQCAELVGGKGCQLAMLTQLDTKDFVVPQGFCLTLAAFEKQLDNHEELRKSIATLKGVACGSLPGDLKQVCEAVTLTFTSVTLAQDIQKEITAELSRQFGVDHDHTMFAVRSSAAGEDSSDMSAAGQMDTFLGMKGLNQIFEAVTKCWASQFALPAVEYRRQHGQAISSGMGVVIQEMVPAQAAGVLFTRDPMTGNPGKMMLNANYGLGESVVSGEAEPDTVTITRTWDDKLSVGEKQLGRKNVQINLTESGGTSTTEVKEGGESKCSVTDDIILRLGAIGVDLEKRFSDPRDIEWAVKGDTIYLLQARPITTLDQESEDQLLHEFDTPLASDRELMTTCNIGEMMPSAMTPLTLSVFMSAVDRAGQDMYQKGGVLPKVHNFSKFTGSCANMGFINFHFVLASYEGKSLGNDKRMAEVAVMGETREDLTLEEIQDYHGTCGLVRRISNAVRNFRHLSGSTSRMETWYETLKTYRIAGQGWKTAQELYDNIDENLHKFYESWLESFTNSASSGTWASVLMGILSRGQPVWTTEHYGDVAMMLSACDDVYSADVPAALQKMAATIRASGTADHFVTLSPEASVAWLKSPEAGQAQAEFSRFMDMHGHRCVKEAEFLEKSWQTEPHKVSTVLQTMLKNSPCERSAKKILSCAEAIKQIKTETTLTGRLALKYILPKARKAVGIREWGKSTAVKMTEVFKQAYWELAKLMVLEGRLPKEELLFFLTHKEIGQLLKTRSGKLVAKTHRRQKIYPKQLELQFPRISRGHPEVIEDNGAEDDFVITSLKLQGMPVSQGVVRGRARVVKTLQEAESIQVGEILIVPFTDVGWSPYFPLISGLVTEIGGLVSHGAVVAREYGLPCVVKVPRATSLFKTGDVVLLNGSTGVLQKIELDEEDTPSKTD